MLRVPPSALRLPERVFWWPGRYGEQQFLWDLWQLRYHEWGNRPAVIADEVVEDQTLVELAVYLGISEIECHDNSTTYGSHAHQ